MGYIEIDNVDMHRRIKVEGLDGVIRIASDDVTLDEHQGTVMVQFHGYSR